MRLIIFLIVLGIGSYVLAAPATDTKPVRREVNKPATIELFGNKITLPQWMSDARTSMLNFFVKVKKFFSGDMQLQTEVFGSKISFRTNIPDTKEDVSKSIIKFFSSLKTDAATRIIFVIYLNIVVMFVTYTVFFIKQIQFHRRQKREEKIAKKQRKIDEEERRWLVSGDLGTDDAPILSNTLTMASMPKVFEEKRGLGHLDTSLFEQGVRDLGDDDISLQLDNTVQDPKLVTEMISPVSNKSFHSREIEVKADIHSPANGDSVN